MFRISAAILCGVEHKCTELSECPGRVKGAADSPEPRRAAAVPGSTPSSRGPHPLHWLVSSIVMYVHAAKFVLFNVLFKTTQHPNYMSSDQYGGGFQWSFEWHADDPTYDTLYTVFLMNKH